MLAIIADDLTGAGDAAVQFAQRGWRTFVTWGRNPSEVRGRNPDVIAVTTDSRALSNAEAERLTFDALHDLVHAGADRAFLKIDSTMRGSIPGQIAGALAAWRERHPGARAIVCPAYPRMERTVESGRVLVSGTPVERTAIGRDPVTPVATSDMSVLVPLSDSVMIADAASDADLADVAGRVVSGGAGVFGVGSGGLAGAIAESLNVHGPAAARDPAKAGLDVRDYLRHDWARKRKQGHRARILLLVTSLNPVSRAQMAHLRERFPSVEILASPEGRVDSSNIADTLAARFRTAAGRQQWDLFGFVGGDGARATLRALDASAIRIIDSVVEGIPFGTISGGPFDGTFMFTKAGGFGREDALVRVVERLSA